jgi:hypothetical protein
LAAPQPAGSDRAGEAMLLVHGASHDDRRPWRRPLDLQPVHDREHRRHAAFDVARSTAMQPAVANLRIEGRTGHAIDRHGVLMRFEQNDLAAALGRRIAIDSGKKIFTLVGDLLAPGRNFKPAKNLLQMIGQPRLEKLRPADRAPHRIHAGNCHQFAQSFD